MGYVLNAYRRVQEGKKNRNLMYRRQEIMLQYTYPRLDVHVSTQMNHLLKSPFVVHPKTGELPTTLPCAPRTMGPNRHRKNAVFSPNPNHY